MTRPLAYRRLGGLHLWLRVAVAAAVFGISPAAFAQVAGAEITGVIADQAGAPVARATVTVTNEATNQSRIVMTSANGIYTVPSLAPGLYRLEAALGGFKTARHAGGGVATGEKARVDLQLTVGDVREEVTVTASAPALRAETASLGAVVDQEQIVELPLNGRTFISLASLAPGVALPPSSQLPRIN